MKKAMYTITLGKGENLAMGVQVMSQLYFCPTAASFEREGILTQQRVILTGTSYSVALSPLCKSAVGGLFQHPHCCAPSVHSLRHQAFHIYILRAIKAQRPEHGLVVTSIQIDSLV